MSFISSVVPHLRMKVKILWWPALKDLFDLDRSSTPFLRPLLLPLSFAQHAVIVVSLLRQLFFFSRIFELGSLSVLNVLALHIHIFYSFTSFTSLVIMCKSEPSKNCGFMEESYFVCFFIWHFLGLYLSSSYMFYSFFKFNVSTMDIVSK